MKHFLTIGCLILIFSCNSKPEQTVIKEVSLLGVVKESKWPATLAEWELFNEPIAKLIPKDDVFPYEINSTLFTDYAFKARFIKLPKGGTMEYHETETLGFPIGTVLIKFFYYPTDFSIPNGERRILETRLLIKGEMGWEAIPYIWNDEQTNATLALAGGSIDVTFANNAGKLVQLDYSVPNQVQCKSCHERNGKFSPIGPSARQLNRNDQLINWQDNHLLVGVPENGLPTLVDYNDESKSLNDRARAWLEINCAHCHSIDGPAKNTGLYLSSTETDNYKLGIKKPPVAAGKGSGGFKYDIVPGDPETSILYYRIKSVDPGVMMPELGRKLEHKEGVELIQKWILTMSNYQ